MKTPRGLHACTWVLFLTLFGVAITAVACREATVPRPVEVVRPIKFQRIVIGDQGVHFEYPGRIAPARQADMAFEIGGKIVELPVAEGQSVVEGQLLARLDVRDVQAALDAEVARQRVAEAEFRRLNALFEQGIASRRELDQATANLDVLNAAVRTASKRVDDAILRAPFAGRVARKMVEDFANVQAKQVVLVLQDESWLEVKVDIPEGDLRFAGPDRGQAERVRMLRPEVEIPSFRGRRFPGRVTEFATAADPATRTFSATVAFEPPRDIVVLPGMTATVMVRLDGDGRRSILLPVHAVASGAKGVPFVWRLDPETMQVQRASVVVGALAGGSVAIVDGLADGDEVAVSGVAQLRAGMPVRRLED